MRKRQRIAVIEIRLNILLVDCFMTHVRRQKRDHARRLCSVGDFHHRVPVFGGLFSAGPACAAAYDHIASGVFQVKRMRPALAAITDDRNLFILQNTRICVFVLVDFHRRLPLLLLFRC